jgi:DNA polymerase III sliding clamp (beta) subunit (PCNA family)
LKTNIEIPVADLRTVLPGLSKIVSKRASLPVLGCVKVTLNDDRSLHIQANNLDQIVTARLSKSFKGTPGVMLVPFDELSSIAKKCSATDTIELSATKKETSITYPAAGTRINKPVTHLGVEEFPPATEVQTEAIKLDDAFKEALQEALDCSSTDQSRYVINGACLDVSKKEAHYVVGTNGRHLYSANSFLFDVPQNVIVPPGKFLTWAGFVDDGPWTLRFQPEVKGKGKARVDYKPAWIRLDSDNWTFLAKPIEGEYPNWKQVVPTADSIKSQITLAEPGIKIILDALPLLPGNEDMNQPVSLEIKGEYLTLKAKGKGDWTEIPIPAKVSGLPVTVSMNRIYLAKALKFGCTQVGITDSVTPVSFTTKGKTFVVSPIGPPTEAAAKVPDTRPTSPTENASAETPSPAEPTNQTETERTTMPAKNTMSAPQRGNLTSHNNEPAKPAESSASLIDQIDQIKDTLKNVVRDLNGLVDAVKQAEKDQRASEKEVEAARATLKKLQQVSI